MLTISNALKAQIIVTLNGIAGVLIAFDVGHLTAAQIGSVDVAANGVLGLLVLVTYKASSKRTPDAPPPAVQP